MHCKLTVQKVASEAE